MTCWDYLAEAILAKRGCACGHSEDRHYLRDGGEATEWQQYGAIVAPVVVRRHVRKECALCPCACFAWNRTGFFPDGSAFIYDTAAVAGAL